MKKLQKLVGNKFGGATPDAPGSAGPRCAEPSRGATTGPGPGAPPTVAIGASSGRR